MDAQVKEFIIQVSSECLAFVRPVMHDYGCFQQELGKLKKVKPGDNEQFNFDIKLDGMIKNSLQEYQISGRVFSEESGFFNTGEEKYRVVYDPFCNSSLATRTFWDAAMGIAIFTWDYRLITSAILDYQTGLLGMIVDGKGVFYQLPKRKEVDISKVKVKNLEDAWVVVTLENPAEREHRARVDGIMAKAKRVMISSGHLYWLRLAMGKIDAYLDPFGGEALYEMFAASLAQANGCLVTNLEGEEFNAGKMLRVFEQDPEFWYYPVAATNGKLHREILSSLTLV